ncbi:YiiX/YebB-like N1pC/P60 family cysteine hydrolase [Bordetella muralis]|uniref:YiiX/YebB-like N1pC/P60 family cysteine hydrolase n=1 Tax=Bordetella muralis TaxID=1649130 RepID=UPI0039F07059
MPTRFATIFLPLALTTLPAHAHDFTEWRTGDLVFQDSAGPQSTAIRTATKSHYTHMGIVRLTPSGPVVIEAARTVSETPLTKFLARGQQGQYAVYRLNTATPEGIQTALAEASRYTGRPYDIFFRLEPDAIYCSELPYYAFKAAGITLGKTERFGTLAIDNPAVRTLFLARWEKHPDCQATDQAGCWRRIQAQLLVTPASIAADPQVTRIFSNFRQE